VNVKTDYGSVDGFCGRLLSIVSLLFWTPTVLCDCKQCPAAASDFYSNHFKRYRWYISTL